MIRVLIVDDEMLARVGLKSLISWEEQGYELVGEADNGEKALTLIKQLKPDIVLTDAKMPVMDGVSLIEECTGIAPEVRFIVLSAYGDYDYVRRALKNGAVDYLLKLELEPEKLLAALKRAGADAKPRHDETAQLALKQRYLELLSGVDEAKMQSHIIAIQATDAPARDYYLLLSRAQRGGEPLHEHQTAELSRVLSETIGGVAAEYGKAIAFVWYRYSAVCTVFAPQGGRPSGTLRALAQRAAETVAAMLQLELHTGVSVCQHDLQSIREAGLEAMDALKQAERLGENYCAAEDAPASATDSERRRTVTQVMQYVKDNIEQPIALEEVARFVGLSSGYLSKLFKADTGMRFTSYVQQEKVRAAKNLLASGRYRVHEVALKLGFENVTYFTKLFRAQVGRTPQDYKLHHDK